MKKLLLSMVILLCFIPATIFAAQSISIKDDIENTGQLQINAVSGAKSYVWHKKTGNGSFQEVERELITGENGYNISEDGLKLNVVLDNYDDDLLIGSEAYYYVEAFDENETLLAKSNEYKVPYYNMLQNNNFDNPIHDDVEASYSFIFNNINFMQVPNGYEGLVWKTTGKGPLFSNPYNKGYYVEIASTKGSNLDHLYDVYCVKTAHNGDQFAELNCEAEGALYQDILTHPGGKLTWQLSHHARTKDDDKTDQMYVILMPTSEAESKGTNGSAIDTQEEVKDIIKNPTKYPIMREYGK